MDTAAPLLEVHSIRKAFPKPDGSQLLVLDDLNLELAEGQIVGLLGRSGSGKSTCCGSSRDLRVQPLEPSPISVDLCWLPHPGLPWCSRASRCFRG